jgi:3-oxoadipate enol-lactonase
MPKVSANGIEVHYQIGGRGPRLLYISGSGGDLRNARGVFEGPLPEHFEVLSYDQRGLGQTDKPPGDYSMADYAADGEALLDALEWPSVPVVGVSFGGMVAQELALRYPDRIEALVLACTSSGGRGGASYPLHEIADLEPDDRITRQLVAADVRRDEAWRIKHPERWQRLLDIVRNASRKDRDPQGPAKPLAARAGHDTWERLVQIDVPVLVAGGEHDGLAPPTNLEAIANRIPNAKLKLFDGGHYFLVQDKSAYPYLIDWLRRLESGST